MNNINTTFKFKFGENEHIFQYPTVSQKLTIENYKMALTNNMYGELARTETIKANKLLNVIDGFVMIMVCSNVKLKLDDFVNLDPLTELAIATVMVKQIEPFMNGVDEQLEKAMKELTGNDEEDEETEEPTTDKKSKDFEVIEKEFEDDDEEIGDEQRK